MSIDRQTRRGGQRLARDLRVNLMAAHLGLKPEERPLVEDPYPYFDRLRALADFLGEHLAWGASPVLSMGMTDDFEAAIAAGATMVRIGRAIFGERAPRKG